MLGVDHQHEKRRAAESGTDPDVGMSVVDSISA